MNRRHFLEFTGRSFLAATLASNLSGCATSSAAKSPGKSKKIPFTSLDASSADELRLAEGFQFQPLISWGDPINGRDHFGFNNDFTAMIPIPGKGNQEGLLWVNHESVDPIFVTGWTNGQKRTNADVIKEMHEVGGSILHLRKENGQWKLVPNSVFNRRINALTPISLISPRPIAGALKVKGTLANCAGGKTPWGTILTCEENYDNFVGENVYGESGIEWKPGKDDIEWHKIEKRSPEHYGWVVEVNPFNGEAKKLTAMGRFSHESATVVVANDGRCVVYSGDDHNDECLYKFIAARRGSLEEGELFVADTANGKWLSLNLEKQPLLKEKFKDQTEVLIRAREAARIVGATLLDRPEDVEVDPSNGNVYVTLTNNKNKNNFHGSILKIVEKNGDHLSLEFEASTFLTGGPNSQFTCPDNLAFDKAGNLWLTNDVSDSALNKDPYTAFGNNSLFYIPMHGSQAGEVFRVATAPVTAEFTGPSFSPDGETLFLSVQHPGEGTTDLKNPLSRWSPSAKNLPRSTVVMINGPSLAALVSN